MWLFICEVYSSETIKLKLRVSGRQWHGTKGGFAKAPRVLRGDMSNSLYLIHWFQCLERQPIQEKLTVRELGEALVILTNFNSV